MAENGILLKNVGGLYEVRPLSSDRTVYCRARGLFRHQKLTPLVGDHVVFEKDTENRDVSATKGRTADHVIVDILPRTTELTRPPLANLTHLVLVLPAAYPTPDLITADKLLTIAEHVGIRPILVISKSDLDGGEAARLADVYRPLYPTFTVSTVSGEGVAELLACLASLDEEAPIAAFAGVSGAGKSSLLSSLFPNLSLASGALSEKIGRGKNTTRASELFPLSVGESTLYLADTPGFSMLDFEHGFFYPLDELPVLFPEFRDALGRCRYTDCSHTAEDGCGVLDALRAGKIAPSRHASYRFIREELLKTPEWKRVKRR